MAAYCSFVALFYNLSGLFITLLVGMVAVVLVAVLLKRSS
jgi:hypothetical protein